jgi:integrase
MSVLKRNGVYHFRFVYRGRVVRKSTRQCNHKVALDMESAERTALAKGDAGLGEKPQAPTLARFLVDRIKPWAAKKKATTATWYRSGIEPLTAYKPLSQTALDMITGEQIDDYTAHRHAQGRAVGTINRELRVLRRSLRQALAWGLVAKVPEVSMAGAEVRRERVVSGEEFSRYLVCASPLLANVALLLYETGLRPDESHRLEWSDINLEHGRLLVRHGKTAAARRQLPLSPGVRAMLGILYDAAGKPETGFVFPAPTRSGHIEHYTLKKQHRAALKKSGVRKFLLYSLRHTFATRLAPHVDAWTLCRIMGWASLSVAMTYVHAQDDRVLAAFSRSEEISGHKFGHIVDKEIPGGLEVVGNMVSAAGFEPATHALKGHRVKSRQRGFSSLHVVKAVENRTFGSNCTRIATRVISTNIVKSELNLRTNRNQARPIAYAAFSTRMLRSRRGPEQLLPLGGSCI